MKKTRSFKLAVTVPIFIALTVLGIFMVIAATKKDSSDIRSRAGEEGLVMFTGDSYGFPAPYATKFTKNSDCRKLERGEKVGTTTTLAECAKANGTFSLTADGNYTLRSMLGYMWVYFKMQDNAEFTTRITKAKPSLDSWYKIFLREDPAYNTEDRMAISLIKKSTNNIGLKAYYCTTATNCKISERENVKLPLSLKIARNGQVITTSYSYDGTSWEQLIQFNAGDLEPTYYVGLDVESYKPMPIKSGAVGIGDPTLAAKIAVAEGVFDSVSITGSTGVISTPVPVPTTTTIASTPTPTQGSTVPTTAAQWWSGMSWGKYVCPPASVKSLDCRGTAASKYIYCTMSYIGWMNSNCDRKIPAVR